MTAASFKEQLALLKAATVRTGAIHEAQALQLRMWPLLIPDTKSATAKVDTERKIVTYECKTTKAKLTVKAKTIMKNITIWTRSILWDDTTIVFKLNGKVVYDSRS